MQIMKNILLPLALLAHASTGMAADTTYTDQASFLAQLAPGYYQETFSSYSYGSPLTYDNTGLGPLSQSYGPVNGYSWTATETLQLGLFSVQNALSTNYSADPLVITFTGAPVTALGGAVSSVDLNGNVYQEPVVITLSDGANYTLNSGSGFVGFTSDAPIASITLEPTSPAQDNYAALANFYVGANISAPVPEAETWAMLLLGLPVTAWAARRKKAF